MADSSIIEINAANFEREVLQSETPVLVDFFAEWCQPCKMLAPTLNALASEYAGRARIGKIDAEANRDLSIQFDIQKLPTLILFKGGKEAHRFFGLQPKKNFAAELDKASA